jgi:acetyltransferase-like isoleucine patch superfamily enzyme
VTQAYKTKEFLAQFAFVGDDVQIFEQALILKPEVIQLADGVRIDDFTRIEGGSGLRIGKYVHIASFASILGGGEVQIGDFSGIGQGAKLITGVGHPFEDKFPVKLPEQDPYHRRRGKIVMGDYSFVAVNAVIMPDVMIGEGAIVGAGAVVTKNVLPWAIVVGAPAKVIGSREKFIE